MSFTAHLEGLDLNDVFQIVSIGRLSGIATIIHDAVTGRLVFRRGNVVYASSDTQSRLGFWLVQRGVISENDLATALRAQQTNTHWVPLATSLVAHGFVESDALERQTKDHIRRVVKDLLTWESGVVHFKPCKITDRMTVLKQGLSTEALLIKCAAENDDELKLDCELCELPDEVVSGAAADPDEASISGSDATTNRCEDSGTEESEPESVDAIEREVELER